MMAMSWARRASPCSAAAAGDATVQKSQAAILRIKGQVDQIVARMTALGGDHAVLTGGEPMLFAELIPLCERLRAAGWHITIETAGTLYLPVVCDLMSISPKLSNSTPTVGQAPRWRERQHCHTNNGSHSEHSC